MIEAVGRPKKVETVQKAVQQLLAEGKAVTSGSVAEAGGVSRQTAFKYLTAMVQREELRLEGAGAGSRYVALAPVREAFEFPTAGLEEHVAVEQIRARSALARRLGPNASKILDYALSELINNAIDHSGAPLVRVALSGPAADAPAARLTVEVIDEGEGAFEHLRRFRRLASALEAVQDLSKGKVTSDPTRHTGQGLFFSARAVDRLSVESGELRWTIDADLDDTALGQIAPRRGTRVVFELAMQTPRVLKDVFDAYSDDDFGFAKTKTWVRLFETGLHFISRSEAKRLCAGLERFEEAVLDFKGVTEVGQGFCDEVFRVWATAHPGTRLFPERMVPAVAHLVERAKR